MFRNAIWLLPATSFDAVGFQHEDRPEFNFFLKLCFPRLMGGKSSGTTWAFKINEAFPFENRRWANRGLPYFHLLFSQDMVLAVP
jgi:hypothetical protein